MGEAKNREAHLRARIVAELEKHMVPTWPAEEQLVDEIRALQFYECRRVPDHQLDYMRMEPQKCHVNAAAYVNLDPTGTSWHQGGWWKRNGVFYFHSVILIGEGKLRCVTPHPDRSVLQFAPDDEVDWSTIIDGARHPRRHGLEVPILVRDEPDKVIAQATEARDRILAGERLEDIRVPF